MHSKNLFCMISFLGALGLMAQPPCNGMASLDSDNDGKISLEEFKAGSDLRFERLDIDGDGYLTVADRESRAGRRGEAQRPRQRRGQFLIALSDADGDHVIQETEWQAFVETLPADESGAIDVDALHAMMMANRPSDAPHPPQGRGMGPRHFDLDEDGILETEDLLALFAQLDLDGSSTLEGDELAGRQGRFRGRRGGLIGRADSDGDRQVTTDEWTEFVAALPVDDQGNVDWSQFGRFRGALRIDLNEDGMLNIDELNEWFASLDTNADGTITCDEFPGHHGKRRKGRRG